MENGTPEPNLLGILGILVLTPKRTLVATSVLRMARLSRMKLEAEGISRAVGKCRARFIAHLINVDTMQLW